MVVFSIVESAAFRMFVSGLICGEPFTVIFLLNFNARTFSKGRFQLGNCVITCREAYERSFWYHFLKGIATPQVGYTLARIQQSCAPLEIIEFDLLLRRFTTVWMRRIFPHGLECILGICQGISFIEPLWDRFSFLIYMEF